MPFEKKFKDEKYANLQVAGTLIAVLALIFPYLTDLVLQVTQLNYLLGAIFAFGIWSGISFLAGSTIDPFVQGLLVFLAEQKIHPRLTDLFEMGAKRSANAGTFLLVCTAIPLIIGSSILSYALLASAFSTIHVAIFPEVTYWLMAGYALFALLALGHKPTDQ